LEDFDAIFDLISSGQEGGYWDFKECWHSNKARLLHDIICMANNLENREAFIIFGVTDQGEICGVENNRCRKTQENLTSFLRDKQFSRGIRPSIALSSLSIQNHTIDILRVNNTMYTPYYLEESYRDNEVCVRAHYIYTRILDTNTPIDRSADPLSLEFLWKKRFGLVPSIQQRFFYAVSKRSAWEVNSEGWYFTEAPEFTITLYDEDDTSTREPREFYSYNQTNERTSFGVLKCRYFGTVIHETQRVVLDSGRYQTTVPKWGFIKLGDYGVEVLAYKYFLTDHIDYQLHLFLFNEESHEARIARQKFQELILYYASDSEREAFENYLYQRTDEVLTNIIACKANRISAWLEEHEKGVQNYRINTGLVLKKMLTEFRNSKQSL
jgi:hypothetical protein